MLHLATEQLTAWAYSGCDIRTVVHILCSFAFDLTVGELHATTSIIYAYFWFVALPSNVG